MIHLVKVNFKSLYSLSKKAFSYLSISSVFWMVFYQVRPWSPTLQRTGGVTYPETDISLNVVSKEKNPNIMNQRNPRIKKNDFKMFFFFFNFFEDSLTTYLHNNCEILICKHVCVEICYRKMQETPRCSEDPKLVRLCVGRRHGFFKW